MGSIPGQGTKISHTTKQLSPYTATKDSVQHKLTSKAAK